MNDTFDGQKDILKAIRQEINLLQQQVDYLIRNDKPLGLLDLDVMMNRTHQMYDLMCRVNLGEDAELPVEEPDAEEDVPATSDDEELPVGLKEIKALFGIEEKAKEEGSHEELIEEKVPEELPEEDEEELTEEQAQLLRDEIDEEADAANESAAIPDETPEEEDAPEEDESAYFIEEADDDIEGPIQAEVVPEPEEIPEPIIPERIPEPEPELLPEPEPEPEPEPDFGFILKFEPAEPEPAPNRSVFTTGDEIEMTIPHLLDETLPPAQDEDLPEPTRTEPTPSENTSFEPIVIGQVEERDDSDFELEPSETLGDHYQHNAVNDLQNAIGINDKFLFVNELFSGSMDKYNRSIGNLNDVKTLNGALIYLNELRVELQWNSNNEAYKKLLELVHRKFEA